MKFLKFIFFILLVSSGFKTLGNHAVITVKNNKVSVPLGDKVLILEDPDGKLKIHDVVKLNTFKESNSLIPNFGITQSSFWLKFILKNSTPDNSLLLEVQNPVIDELELYTVDNNLIRCQKLGEYKDFEERSFNHQNFIFRLDIPENQTRTFFLKIKSTEQLQIPLEIGTSKTILEAIFLKDLIFGIYIGIVLVMSVYNLFLFFTVRDKSYLYYVSYIFTVGLVQASIQGYAFKYLWPHSLWIAKQSMFIVPASSGIAVILFTKHFLRTRVLTPKLNFLLDLFIYAYIFSIALSILNYFKLSVEIINFLAILGSLTILYIGIALSWMGDRQAKFFLIAWSIFFIGICVFVLKNLGILPFNNFTAYSVQAGSAVEVVLLSFALGDRINILKKEKEQSQADALNALRENERIITEQNIILESKVQERTIELQEAIEELNVTLTDLKDTQSKLVESEKMASLGQLTAGIAHEINNPINFVSSSITPLKRDIKFLMELLDKYTVVSTNPEMNGKFDEIRKFEQRLDLPYLKEEIETIITGISDGASRTSEIVRGLKNFSRLDETDLKMADINTGLDSTLILLNNKLSGINLVKNYGKIPVVECYGGKINQVFMNILSNSIHALEQKPDSEMRKIIITTSDSDTHVLISIKDNGTGIPDHIRNKIFDPFFTTKEVGEGTGLGLSIVYNIIQNHHGEITMNSELGIGTEFIISLPKFQKV